MNYLDRTFSFFPANIKITKPLGEISLREMLRAIQSPKEDIKQLFSEIERAAKEGDLKRKAELKSKLYYFCPCVKLDGNGRSYVNITGFTKLAVLDFDGLEHEHAKEFQKFLFNEYPYIISTMLSASKKGIKAIVNIGDVLTVDEFKAVFYALAAEMEQYEGFDGTAQNPVLSFYLTYSPELLIREDATIFNSRGYKPDSFKAFEGEYEVMEDVVEEDKVEIENILRRSFEKITDSGHYICRSTCLAGYGYAAAGYYEPEEMRELLYTLIEETPYLHKSLSNYKKTCDDMMSRGLSSPIFLDKHRDGKK